jgi:iron complex transport system substrate-binding protein
MTCEQYVRLTCQACTQGSVSTLLLKNSHLPVWPCDAAVRTFADAQETVYAIDAATLEGLAPDLVIVQDQCRVCTVRPDDLACSAARTLILKPETLADCLDDVCRVAEALGEPRRGAALRASLQARLDAVAAAAAAAREEAGEAGSAARRPRVAVLEWCAPIMGCGYWIPELVSLAGGEPVLCAPPGGRTPTLASADDVLAARPDVVVFALCGFDIPRAAEHARSSGRTVQTRH